MPSAAKASGVPRWMWRENWSISDHLVQALAGAEPVGGSEFAEPEIEHTIERGAIGDHGFLGAKRRGEVGEHGGGLRNRGKGGGSMVSRNLRGLNRPGGAGFCQKCFVSDQRLAGRIVRRQKNRQKRCCQGGRGPL
jgi:hypothetical protein